MSRGVFAGCLLKSCCRMRRTPLHIHRTKDQDIINRGGMLVVKLFKSSSDNRFYEPTGRSPKSKRMNHPSTS